MKIQVTASRGMNDDTTASREEPLSPLSTSREGGSSTSSARGETITVSANRMPPTTTSASRRSAGVAVSASRSMVATSVNRTKPGISVSIPRADTVLVSGQRRAASTFSLQRSPLLVENTYVRSGFVGSFQFIGLKFDESRNSQYVVVLF